MTVHGSKGLEFPHVILLDFPETKKRASNTPLFFWDRERGAYLAGKDEKGERLRKDSVEQEWKKLEIEKDLAESKRVLYVALTRAKDRLLLVLPTTDDEKKRATIANQREKIADFTTVDFWRGWIEPALKGRSKLSPPERSSPLPETASESASPRSGEPPKFLPRRPRHSVSEWNLLSRCERSYEWSVIRPLAPTEDEEWREFIAVEKAREEKAAETRADRGGARRPKIAQSEIGTRVHRALELEEPGGLLELEKLLGATAFRASPVIAWMEKSSWMRIGAGAKAWKELAFEVPIPGATTATLIGALDRLVRGADGNFVILDFKVTGRMKSEADLLEAYRTQLNLYAWALEALVPESRGKIRALLVHIAGGQVLEIEVPLEPNRLSEFRTRAEEILRGKPGEPQPGSLCEVCDHAERCPEGKQWLESPK